MPHESVNFLQQPFELHYLDMRCDFGLEAQHAILRGALNRGVAVRHQKPDSRRHVRPDSSVDGIPEELVSGKELRLLVRVEASNAFKTIAINFLILLAVRWIIFGFAESALGK